MITCQRQKPNISVGVNVKKADLVDLPETVENSLFGHLSRVRGRGPSPSGAAGASQMRVPLVNNSRHGLFILRHNKDADP